MVETTKRLFHYVTDKVGDGIDVTKSTVLFPITVSHGALELFRAARETRQITSHERKDLSAALLELRLLLNSGHPDVAVRVINQKQIEYTLQLTDTATLKCYYTRLGEDQFRVQIDFKHIDGHGKPEYEFWGPFHVNQRFQSIRVLKLVLRHENAREVEQAVLQDLGELLSFLYENIFQFVNETTQRNQLPQTE